MTTSVFCIAATQAVASNIVNRLKNSGFSNNDISALFPDKTGTRDFAHETSTKAPEGAAAGAGAGGLAGGALGLLAGIGLLAIPGVGPFIAAGPIMASLGGIAVGATVGGITGGLIGLGIPELEAKRYEGKIKDGNILISVHAASSEEIATAKKIYGEEGATDIGSTGEATVPTPSKPDMSKRPQGPDYRINSDNTNDRVSLTNTANAVNPDNRIRSNDH